MRKFLLTVICCFVALTVFADDDMMITRDGNFIKVKVLKISSTEVVFIDLKKKRRGELKAPADYIYAILKEKGHNTLKFSEENIHNIVSGDILMYYDLFLLKTFLQKEVVYLYYLNKISYLP